MAYDFKSETDVKDYLQNLGIEYRFGCYSEKNPEACHLLGDYLESVKKDFEKAGKVYKNNCDDHSYAKSCLKYANFLLLGKGEVKEDYESSYKYFDKACGLNEADACFHQGLLLVTSSNKTKQPEDVLKAMNLLEKACTSKNANACYYLSGMHIAGVKKKNDANSNDKKPKDIFKVPRNMQLAYKYTLEGCNLGNIYCCANLSQMYARGEGIEKNQELADKYKKVALAMQNELLETNKTLTFQEGLK